MVKMRQLKDMNWREMRDFHKRRDKQLKLNAKRAAERDESKRLDRATPNENDIKKIKKTLRQVWSWSHARRLVIRRCELGGGYYRCEGCRKRAPKVHVDHVKPVGTFDEGYIKRLFVPSDKMQGLCTKCHGVKTKKDLKDIRIAKKLDSQDFY